MIILSRCSSWRLFSYILFWFYLSITVSPYSWNQLQCRWDAWRVKKCGDKAEGYRRGHLEYTYTRANPDDCWLLRILSMQRLETADISEWTHITQLATTCWTKQQGILFYNQLFSCSCNCRYSVDLWGPWMNASHCWRKCCRYLLFRHEIDNSTVQSLKTLKLNQQI